MNTYPDSVRFLYSLGNEIKAFKFGLDTIARVLAELGHPEQACRVVHVAGTNGKGSTCAMIASVLREAGHRTGLYTSPHLVEPTERIQIDGERVTEADFARAFDVVHAAAERLVADGEIENHPTYFETVTAMAFVLFRERACDWVVLEVGLGGRLDATNVVMPELCVITPVDYDHEAWLGPSIEAIAAEKAGILKAGVPVVMAKQRADAEAVITACAEEVGARVLRAADAMPSSFVDEAYGSTLQWGALAVRCPFAGLHQVDNTVTALVALRELGVADESMVRGIAAAQWPGRLERIREAPEVILDGAHNPAGVRALAAHIRRHYAARKVWLIYGTMRDKSVGEICEELFPLAAELILTAPDSPRALAPESLLAIAGHPRARVAATLGEAWDVVVAEAAPGDVVFISGSLYLVGEARAMLVQ
ncbi:MAG: bifunctional folylpolyglutamate synthase/dihydrofolate synthase [Acidobacteria bacterium]|nr:bifunctional folylpolyglutamate synthase/dihydrofolate synthase [Acidobacteriota bacterium]